MIWVIGGTSDAVKIVDLLVVAKKRVLVSTTTSYGKTLAKLDKIKVIKQKLNTSQMQQLINLHQISTVVDASHPFACEVSVNAIKACNAEKVRYMRYERPTEIFTEASYYNNFQELIQSLQNTQGNILLTVGTKNLAYFKDINQDRLIVRVLPIEESIKQCAVAKLLAHQIIAIKGRLSMETNKSLMQEYSISHLVTKDAGEAGGMNEKVNAAISLGIEIHIVGRPLVNYPEVYNNYNEILNNLN